MAELRSFVIGVSIAGAILLLAAVAFGAFSGGDSNSPSVVFLGTPPATRTPAPAATRPPAENTPPLNETALPIETAEANETPEGQTPEPQQPQPTQPAQPAPEPTNTPVPQAPAPTATPAGPTASGYLAVAVPLGENLQAQLAYLAGNAGSPNVENPDWVSFTQLAVSNVQGLVSDINSLAVPDCMASAHGTLSGAAGEASSAAAQLLAAIDVGNPEVISNTAGLLNGASASVGAGIGAVNAAC